MKLNFDHFMIALAPMAGVTDFAFRKICADFGADMVVTEMISLKAFQNNSKTTEKMLREESSAIRGCQVFFHDPEIAKLISDKSGIEVVLWDERCTTVTAHNYLSMNNVRGKKRKQTVDAVAAVIILEDYLRSL